MFSIMKLLKKMFFIIEELEQSDVEQHFLQEGFIQKENEAGTWIFLRQLKSNRWESVLLRGLNNGFNYCKVSFQDELAFKENLTAALTVYGFKIIEDDVIKVLRNEEFILMFSQFEGVTFSITLAKRNKEFEKDVSVEIHPLS